jgi:hypothetical protein
MRQSDLIRGDRSHFIRPIDKLCETVFQNCAEKLFKKTNLIFRKKND